MDLHSFRDMIWDMTVGAGTMPEYFSELRPRVEKRLGRELTTAELWDCEQAFQGCP